MMIRLGCAAAVLLTVACGSNSMVSTDAGRVRADIVLTVGQEYDVTLGTVGPGNYDSIPSISAPVVKFLDAAYVGPFTPAGPHQLFRFTAQEPGTAVITFRSTNGSEATRTVEVSEK